MKVFVSLSATPASVAKRVAKQKEAIAAIKERIAGEESPAKKKRLKELLATRRAKLVELRAEHKTAKEEHAAKKPGTRKSATPTSSTKGPAKKVKAGEDRATRAHTKKTSALREHISNLKAAHEKHSVRTTKAGKEKAAETKAMLKQARAKLKAHKEAGPSKKPVAGAKKTTMPRGTSASAKLAFRLKEHKTRLSELEKKQADTPDQLGKRLMNHTINAFKEKIKTLEEEVAKSKAKKTTIKKPVVKKAETQAKKTPAKAHSPKKVMKLENELHTAQRSLAKVKDMVPAKKRIANRTYLKAKIAELQDKIKSEKSKAKKTTVKKPVVKKQIPKKKSTKKKPAVKHPVRRKKKQRE